MMEKKFVRTNFFFEGALRGWPPLEGVGENRRVEPRGRRPFGVISRGGRSGLGRWCFRSRWSGGRRLDIPNRRWPFC